MKENEVIAMIFEFWFDQKLPGVFKDYLAASAEVRTHLAAIDGFHGVERFESCSEPGKFLAVGFFADEAAVTEWRNRPEHRRVQALGRSRFFTKYRLRMAEIVRDYGSTNRAQAPQDSRVAHV